MQFTREDMARDFAAWRGCAPLRDSMIFTEAGLVLGRGTLLATLEEDAGAGPGPGFDEPRILAHLIGAYGQPVSGDVIKKIRRASALWRAGDKGFAQIYLALAGLPRIKDWDAYRLHLVNKLLRRGLGPGDVLKIMGFRQEARELEKKYNQNQPRVPAGSGGESGRWTSGGGGGAGQRIVQRVDLNVVGATRSDANPPGIAPGAQYAQANPAPVISAKTIDKMLRIHGPDASIKKGSFDAEYANGEAIRGLINQAWEQATPMDTAPSYEDRVIIAGAVFTLDQQTGAKTPYPIGRSGALNTPSVITNTYVVILDSENNVINCYPINPADPINPRDE
ncbi:MAG: hypothetical protein ACLPSF_02305 [Methylocella sp.]